MNVNVSILTPQPVNVILNGDSELSTRLGPSTVVVVKLNLP